MPLPHVLRQAIGTCRPGFRQYSSLRLISVCLLAILSLLLPAQGAGAAGTTRLRSIHFYADPTNYLVSGACPPPAEAPTSKFLTSDHNTLVAVRFADVGASHLVIVWIAPNGHVFSWDRAQTVRLANPYCSEIGIDDQDAGNININPVGRWTVKIEIDNHVVKTAHFNVSRP